jgi:hypothetical protein
VNLLELVQTLHVETGSGGPLPTTVVGLNTGGENYRLLQWIRRADMAIQNVHSDWDFLWTQTSFLTQLGPPPQTVYTMPANVGTVDEESFLIGTGATASPMECHDYLEKKGIAFDDTPSQPYSIYVMPDRTLKIDGVPDAEYRIQYDYFARPTRMVVNDATESVIPEAYREVIVGAALMNYGRYENAPDALENGRAMFSDWMGQLESRYLPGRRGMHAQAEANFFEVEVE